MSVGALIAALTPVVFGLLSFTLTASDLAHAGPPPLTTTRTQTFSSETNVTPMTVEEDEFRTRVIAVSGGAVVFDELADGAPDSPEVEALKASALAALAGSGCTASDFETVDSSRTQTDSSTEDSTEVFETVTTTRTVGPAVITVGDLDQGGTTFVVLPGTENVDQHFHTRNEVTRTTTNTYLNEATLQVSGPCAAPAGVVRGAPSFTG